MYYSSQIKLKRDEFPSTNIKQFPIDIPGSKGDDIIGIKVYEVGELSNQYSLGLAAKGKEIQELTYKEDWLRLTEQTRTKDITIENISNNKVYLDVKSEQAFTGDTTLHIVFVMM